MLGSHGVQRKQYPWDESVRVPFLLRGPAGLVGPPRDMATPFGAVDIMPTLLGLCGIDVPDSVEGLDFSPCLRGETVAPTDAALVACYHPFGEWFPGREYRGVRTERHTYVRALDGPWLLYDNATDPYQLDNLCGRPEHAATQAGLEARMSGILAEQGDEFLPSAEYLNRWGYEVNERGAAPYAARRD